MQAQIPRWLFSVAMAAAVSGAGCAERASSPEDVQDFNDGGSSNAALSPIVDEGDSVDAGNPSPVGSPTDGGAPAASADAGAPSPDLTGESDAGVPVDGGTGNDVSEPDVPPPGGLPEFAQPPLPSNASAGLRYVRTHAPFISGLVTSMGEVPSSAIDTYFDAFHATALQLWSDGLGAPLASWQQQGEIPWVSWVMDNGNSASNQQPLGGLVANPAGRIGYQIGDEPNTQQDFDAMQIGLDTARARDPEGLVIFNWTYNAGNLLPAFFQTSAQDWGVDVFSYDTYSTSRNVYERYTQFSDACRAQQIPCWRYLDSYNDANHDRVLDATDMRWDAMAGLIWGYTGHTWFVYQISDAHALHPALFDAAGSWEAQTTTRFEMGAGRRWDPYLANVGCPEGESDMDIPVGPFTDAFGGHYVAVQNGRHASGTWPVESTDAGEIELHFDFSNAPPEVNRTIVRAS